MKTYNQLYSIIKKIIYVLETYNNNIPWIQWYVYQEFSAITYYAGIQLAKSLIIIQDHQVLSRIYEIRIKKLILIMYTFSVNNFTWPILNVLPKDKNEDD